MNEPTLLSDHLGEVLYRLNTIREITRTENLVHREAVLHAIAQAEHNIAHVIGLSTQRAP